MRRARSRRLPPRSSARSPPSPPAPPTTSRPRRRTPRARWSPRPTKSSSKVKTTSADIERSVLAASSTFGSTMTGKTDEIVTYVQQQTDRLAQIVDSRRGQLVEALTSKTTQLATDIDRVTADALKSIETRGQAFSQSMSTNGADVARSINSAGDLATGAVSQVAQGSRAGLALGDRPVASGLDRGRHRDAGDQQDPAHRHGRPVRAAARGQHPAAGSAHRRPRQPQLAGARAGDPCRRLRLGDERRHLAQRRRHADAGRPVDRVQFQDLQGAGRPRLAVEPSSIPTAARWSRPRLSSSRATRTPPLRLPNARARWNRWSPPSTCAPPISTSGCRASPACSMNCWRLPKNAPATSRAWWRKPPAPALPRSAASSRRFARRPRRNGIRRSMP